MHILFTPKLIVFRSFFNLLLSLLSLEINSQSDGAIDNFIRRNAETVYHNCGTCKMGDPSDNMAVVDNEARVFGIEGLRVVDASIMPSLNSGNTNAPTIMIAEKVADHILGNKLLPKQYVPVYESVKAVKK